MKPTRHVTAALLLAGFAAAGCSKSTETVEAKARPAASAAVKPVATTGEKRTDGEGSLPAATPKIAGPASFGDGQAAYEAKKYSDATAIFDRYTTERPANAWGHYMLGLSAWKSGDLAMSERAFEKALSVDPRHVKSLVNLSRVLIEQKRYDDALARLSSAAEIDPESTEMYRLLGRTYHTQGKTDEAVSAYRRAIELNELDAWSMNNLGLVFLETRARRRGVAPVDQGHGVAAGGASVSQQPGHGTRAHGSLQSGGHGVQGRTGCRSWIRQGQAEPRTRRSSPRGF